MTRAEPDGASSKTPSLETAGIPGPASASPDASSQALSPVIKEVLFSTLIPFNDHDSDPIPSYRVTEAEAHDFPSVGLFYTRVSQWAEEALKGRDRPRSVEQISAFLQELVRYHIFDWSAQLENDRSGISWDYRTGMKSITLPANAPPNFIEYPSEKVVDLVSRTPLGTIKDVMTYWRTTPTKFRVPDGSTLQFLRSPENGADAYLIEISAPRVYTMTFSVLRGASLNNYGFFPPQFEVTPEAVRHIRSFTLLVKCRFEFRRTNETDPQVQDKYLMWAEGLFDGLRESIEGPPRPPIKQQALLLANRIQVFAKQRAQKYKVQGILLYPDTAIDQQKRRDFDLETASQFSNGFGIEFNGVVGELASKGLDTTDVQGVWGSIGLPDTVARVSEEMRRLASQIDDDGNLVQ